MKLGNSNSAKAGGYPLEKLIAAKGKGATVKASKSQIIIDSNTVETELTTSIIAVPFDDKFLVLVKPMTPLKENETIYVMSRFVLKSLKSSFVETTESNFKNGPKYSQEFMDKWRPNVSR